MNGISEKTALLNVMKQFVIMWLLTGVGMFIGSMLPPIVATFMSILAIGALILTWFVKKTKVVKKIMFIVPFLMGFAFYFSVNMYANKLGSGAVMGALVLTIAMFLILGFVGYVAIKRDLGGLGQVLMFALLALILLSIVSIFFHSAILHMIIAFGGLIIFSLYTLYDFNQMKQNGIPPGSETYYALNLYLDFLNLFLKVLQVFDILSSDDD